MIKPFLKSQFTILPILVFILSSCIPYIAENSNEMTNIKKCAIQNNIDFSEIDTLSLPSPDAQTFINQNLPKDSPLRFADAIEVNINPKSNGKWLSTDETTQIWRLRIVSIGSLSLNIGFTTFRMPEGGCLFLYPPDQSNILGPYTEQNNSEHGQLWTPTVDGEEVIIEISIPKTSISQLDLIIGIINRGFSQ